MELLQYAVSNGMIDTALLQKEIEMKNREEILKNHPYSIWQGNDGRWRSFLPDDSKKDGRRPIAKTKLEKLEDDIVSFYVNLENVEKNKKKIVSVKSVYPEWLKYKMERTKRLNYVYRINTDWIKYYLNDPISQDIISKPIVDLTKKELESWAYSMCKKHDMKKKCYYNMSVIMRGVLNYAEEELNLIKESPYSKVKIKPDFFKKSIKPKSETQVFTKNDETLLIEEAYKNYRKDPDNVLYLMVPTFFYTGVRVGELSALMWNDIGPDSIILHQMYGREVEVDENGNFKNHHFEVVDMLKLNADPREVIITEQAKEVLKEIKKYYFRQGIPNAKYVFTDKNGNLPHPSTIDSMFYRLCCDAGILKRSPNKSRKTYISTLIDNGLNINFVREQVGHKDERTTYGNYCFNRSTREETKETLKKALS